MCIRTFISYTLGFLAVDANIPVTSWKYSVSVYNHVGVTLRLPSILALEVLCFVVYPYVGATILRLWSC